MSNDGDTSVSAQHKDERRGGAALFDIDGTLVDSNYLHIEAWSQALSDLGESVDTWRVHRSIGMDSSALLGELLGTKAEGLAGSAKSLHQDYYSRVTPRLRAFRGARELLRDLADRGVIVVLATSAPESELVELRDELDVEDAIAHVTSAEDVEEAKPEPDLVQVALTKAGVSASRAIFIGDTVWDVTAARRAGVDCIGVRSGGISAEELFNAGAVAVYDDVASLREVLDDSPLAVLWKDR